MVMSDYEGLAITNHKSSSRRSESGSGDGTDLQQDQRQVVMQAGAADKRTDFPQDALAELLGRQVAVFLDQRGKPLFTERFTGRVHRLRQTIGEEKDHVAKPQRLRHLLQQTLEPLAVIDLQAQDETVRRK